MTLLLKKDWFKTHGAAPTCHDGKARFRTDWGPPNWLPRKPPFAFSSVIVRVVRKQAFGLDASTDPLT